MKVSRSSWHYRLWRFGRENSRSEPRDLCRYFWHLALVKVLLPLAVAALAMAGIVGIFVTIWRHPIDAAIVVGGILGLLVFVIAVGYLAYRREVREEDRRASGAPPKKPSLTRQYLAARKRKLCPLIEVSDD